MEITIDTRTQTVSPASVYVYVHDKRWDNFTFSVETIVSGLTQEIDGIPVDFFEAMEEVDRGETEPMFGEDGKYLGE